MNQKGLSTISILVVVLAAVLIIGGGAYYLGKNSSNTKVQSQPANQTVISQPTANPTIPDTQINTSSTTMLSGGTSIKPGQTQQFTVPGGMTFTKPADWVLFVLSPAQSAMNKSTFTVQIGITVPQTTNNIISNIDRYNYDGKSTLIDWYKNTLSSSYGGAITGMQQLGTTNMQALVTKGSGQTAYTVYYVINKSYIFGIEVDNLDSHNNQEATDFLNSIRFQ